MSKSHSIRITLNIKDKRIKISNNCVSHKIIRGIKCLFYKGSLSTKSPDFYPKCGCVNKYYDIIKHGFKCIRIKLPRVSNQRTFLDLRKQRYLTQTLQTYLYCINQYCQRYSFNIYQHLPLMHTERER